MTYNYRPLAEALGDIIAKGTQKQDFNVTAEDFIESMRVSAGDVFVDIDEDQVEVTKNAVKTFVSNRLGGYAGLLNDRDISWATKKAYMLEKSRSLGGQQLAVRRGKNKIDGILSHQYTYFDNNQLAHSVLNLIENDDLPPLDDLYAHTYYSDEAARKVNLRIISPDHWNQRNGEEFYTGVSIINDEVGEGSLRVSPAIARVACFNYTLAENVIQQNHQWTSTEMMEQTLRESLLMTNAVGQAMFERIQQTHAIEFDHPENVFDLLIKRFKFPEKVAERAEEYWNNEGSDPSVFGILQAVTDGTKAATEVKGRKKPNWQARDNIERDIWDFVNQMWETHSDGDDINAIIEEGALVSQRKVINAIRTYDSFNDKERDMAEAVVANLTPDDWR